MNIYMARWGGFKVVSLNRCSLLRTSDDDVALGVLMMIERRGNGLTTRVLISNPSPSGLSSVISDKSPSLTVPHL